MMRGTGLMREFKSGSLPPENAARVTETCLGIEKQDEAHRAFEKAASEASTLWPTP